MFRVSVLVCVLVVAGVTAKPWKELRDEPFQETVVSLDENGKLSWPVEVEPPEDTDELQYEIDPRMRIWKSMTQSGDKDSQMAEEDKDELHHPSVYDQLRDQGYLPVSEMQDEQVQEDAESQTGFEEQDWEEVYHKAQQDLNVYLAPLVAKYTRDLEPRGELYEPKMDEDDLYQQEYQPVNTEPLGQQLQGSSVVRVHLQPEEDMDDIYHKDLPDLQPQDTLPQAAGPVQLPSQRKYTEPEEDLDDLYHQ